MKTAVEWLAEHLCDAPIVDYWGAVEKAKEMEKEQMIQVAMYHKDSCVERACIESYINKHFKSQEK